MNGDGLKRRKGLVQDCDGDTAHESVAECLLNYFEMKTEHRIFCFSIQFIYCTEFKIFHGHCVELYIEIFLSKSDVSCK